MMPFRDLPIRRKLTVIIMATSSAALLLACSAFVLHDLVSFRRLLAADLSTLAKIIGSNSTGAILFNDPARARETLGALEAETNVLWACIYDQKGHRLAEYVRKGAPQPDFPPAPPPPGHRFAGGRLLLSTAIVFDGERVGTVFLASDLEEIRARLIRYVGIGALVLLASSLVALLLSYQLQRVVSEPILRLARTARAVSERKDFSVRAGEAHGDELGLLFGAFDDMLDHIEEAQKNLLERAREVERVNRELERSNRELESFASVASHDLQEPLRKITAFGDRLVSQHGDALTDKGRDYLERMQNAATRMQSLIDDLLSYSRVTTRGQPFVPVPLARVAGEVLSDLELRIERTGARVEVGDLPTIDADPTQMRQLLQNLLANALKFQRPGEAPRIRLDSDSNGNGRCQIRVQDNGIGFDEKYLDRLFKPFQRLHGQSAYEGTGIGLAICKKIAERHGGSITARSAPGQGTCFLVDLPVRSSRGEDVS